MQSGTSRTRIEPDSEEAMVSLRRTLGVTSFGINQLNLRSGERRRIHRHERQEELFLVLEGKLSLFIEGEETTLERGELIRVGPEVRRQLTNRGPERLVLLAIGGSEEHQSRDGIAFSAWDSPDEEGRPPQEVPLPPDFPSH